MTLKFTAYFFILLLTDFLLYPGISLSAEEGNPEHWCRNGFFPSDARSDVYGIIKKSNANKSFFYKDDDGCPFPNSKCRKKSYLVPDDSILIANEYKGFVCAWYTSKKGRETVGWIPKSQIEFKKTSLLSITDWTGTWTFYDSEIVIVKSEDGKLSITGTAFWGTGMSVHTGELDITEMPVENTIANKVPDEYDCGVRLRLVNNLMIVNDNKNCGGMNVSFDGVYIRKNN